MLLESFNLELDGQIIGDDGLSTAAYCRIRTPLVRHAPTEIELSIPHACMPAPTLQVPCVFEGTLGLGDNAIKVRLEEVVPFTYTADSTQKTRAGLAPITLTHVGKLIVKGGGGKAGLYFSERYSDASKVFYYYSRIIQGFVRVEVNCAWRRRETPVLGINTRIRLGSVHTLLVLPVRK